VDTCSDEIHQKRMAAQFVIFEVLELPWTESREVVASNERRRPQATW
jgi:hypothetical protein